MGVETTCPRPISDRIDWSTTVTFSFSSLAWLTGFVRARFPAMGHDKSTWAVCWAAGLATQASTKFLAKREIETSC